MTPSAFVGLLCEVVSSLSLEGCKPRMTPCLGCSGSKFPPRQILGTKSSQEVPEAQDTSWT